MSEITTYRLYSGCEHKAVAGFDTFCPTCRISELEAQLAAQRRDREAMKVDWMEEMDDLRNKHRQAARRISELGHRLDKRGDAIQANNFSICTQTKDHTELCDTKAIAKALGCHPHTVYNLIKSGRIPYVRLGGAYRFNLAEVLAARMGSKPVRKEARE